MTVYSYSRLGTFETCPLKYRLAYIDRIPRAAEPVEAFLGSRFHEAMETLYADLAAGPRPLDGVLAVFEERWKAAWHEGVVVARPGRTADDYRAMGRRFIETYYRRHAPFTESRVVGLEQRIDVILDPDGRYRIQGYIDRLAVAPDGTYEIHDYKTSSGLPRRREIEADRQLGLYEIAVRSMWPDARDVVLVWHFVAFDRELRSVRTDAQREAVRRETMGLIDAIEATPPDGFRPRPSALCDWCSYQSLCPLKPGAGSAGG